MNYIQSITNRIFDTYNTYAKTVINSSSKTLIYIQKSVAVVQEVEWLSTYQKVGGMFPGLDSLHVAQIAPDVVPSVYVCV